MVTWNRTKIVVTIGPASESAFQLRAMLCAGADVFRINGAHGTIAQHRKIIRRIREVSKKEHFPAAILVDLPGPKYRIGKLMTEPIILNRQETVTLVCGQKVQIDERIPVPCGIHTALKRKDKIFINDGIVGLVVKEKRGRNIICTVTSGGEVRSRKGINLPHVRLNAPSLTQFDKKILDMAVEEDVDFIGLSFVRSAENINVLRKILKRKAPHIGIIAKIEKPEALDDLDNIISAADAVMIARGDLGIEMPFARLPLIQRDILRRCIQMGKPTITATQMLESMVSAKRPTRAEATDVFVAVWGGSDAVMLSEETSVGISPATAVKAMSQIVTEAESQMAPICGFEKEKDPNNLQAQIIAEAAAFIAKELGAKAIVTPTRSGRTPLFVGRQRPQTLILAPTAYRNVARKMSLYWGVRPMIMPDTDTVDEMLKQAEKAALKSAFIKKGDKIVITSGAHGKKNDVTRLVEVRRV